MTSDILKADIFFVVTTVFVAILAILSIIVGVYVVKILHTIRKISDLIHEQASEVNNDMNDIRRIIKENGATISTLTKIIKTINKKKK